MIPHYYEIFSDGQKFLAVTHNSMAEVLQYPSPDAPAESEKKNVFTGTTRAYMAWVCRLLCNNRNSDFTYHQLHSTGPASPALNFPPATLALLPPIHREAVIDTATGAVGAVLNLDGVTNGVYTVLIRTPGGPPSKAIRETLKGQRLYWNPSDSRGNADYPGNTWLRHHVPAAELQSYRKLATDLRLEFDYLDRNPVKP